MFELEPLPRKCLGQRKIMNHGCGYYTWRNPCGTKTIHTCKKCGLSVCPSCQKNKNDHKHECLADD